MMDLPKRALQCSASAGSRRAGSTFGCRRSCLVVFVFAGIGLLATAVRPYLRAVFQADAANRDYLFSPASTPLSIWTLSGSRTPTSTFFSCAAPNRTQPSSPALRPHPMEAAPRPESRSRPEWSRPAWTTCTVAPGFSFSPGLSASTQIFHRGAVGIHRRAHHRDLAVQFECRAIGRDRCSRIAHLQRRGLAHRNVGAHDHARDIHHGEQRRFRQPPFRPAYSGRSAMIARDRAVDFGIRKLRLGRIVPRFGRVASVPRRPSPAPAG